MLSDPGAVPLDASPVPEDLDSKRRLKQCTKCETFKPYRAHHCSICNRCVIKVRPPDTKKA
jgi:palmitoyltransferase